MNTTSDLVVGKPYSRSKAPFASGDQAIPCVHDSYTTDAFWIRRDDDTHASVWAVRGGKLTSKQFTVQTSTSQVNGTQLGGNVDYSNIGRQPQSAHYRDGRIVWVSNDGHTWAGQSAPSNAVRLVRVNVSTFFDPVPSVTVEIDRIFGRASAADSSGVIFDYGWPAAAATATGDIVVGSSRSRSTIYPELRASVWFAGQSDLSPGVSLRTSSAPLSEFHKAGAARPRAGQLSPSK